MTTTAAETQPMLSRLNAGMPAWRLRQLVKTALENSHD